MGCSPTKLSNLVRKYGDATVLEYSHSILTENFMKSEYEEIRNTIEDRFNSGVINRDEIKKFDKAIERINVC